MSDVKVGTKRGNGNYSDNGTQKKKKKSKKGFTVIRILINGYYSGAIIGKGAQNLRRLQDTYNVRISGLGARDRERVMQLNGNRNDCLAMIKEILPLCPAAPYLAQSQRCPVELNLLVNADLVGLLIGKGGIKSKEICEQGGGKMKVYPDCLPNSNERVVSVGGENASFLMATLEIVMNIVDNHLLKIPTMYYDPSNTAPYHTSGGEVFSETALLMQSFNNIAHDVMSSSNLDIASLLVSRNRMLQRNPGNPSLDFGQAPSETSVTVTKEMCGAIIGKQGKHIAQIRRCSGAKIEWSDDDEGEVTERCITIKGTQNQIQIAEQLMAQYCTRYQSSMVYPLES